MPKNKRNKRQKKRYATKAYVLAVLDKKVEDKSHEIQQGFRPVLATTDYVMTQIAAGDGESNRDGTVIQLKSIYFRAIPEVNATAGKNKIRVLVWIDKSPAGSLAASDILEDATANNCLYSVYNTDNAGKYQILYDKLFIMNNNADSFAKQTHMYKKWKLGHRIKYTGTGATQYGPGQVKITYVSDDATSGVNPPYFSMHGRIMYEDA